MTVIQIAKLLDQLCDGLRDDIGRVYRHVQKSEVMQCND